MVDHTKVMTPAQTRYYMRRFRLFWTISRIASELQVSPLTVKRWDAGENRPPLYRLDDLEATLDRLQASIRDSIKLPQDQWLHKVADALIYDDCPPYTKPNLPGVDIGYMRDWLINKCLGKKVRSSRIIPELVDMGYTKMQVYHTAKQVGIVFDNVKPGRGGYSIWTLPKRGEIT